jgi:hypothetical protein
VLTRWLRYWPENGDVKETEYDQKLRDRFAQVGHLEGPSSTWPFRVVENF